MTNSEIDKLLKMLDKNGLDEIRTYLISEKNKKTSDLIQRKFDEYMNTYVALNGSQNTYICDNEDKIIFSNGISLYYLNKDIVNIKSLKICRNSNLQNTIKRLTSKQLLLFEKNINYRISKLVSVLLNPQYMIHRNFPCAEFSILLDEAKIIEFYFQEKEVETADILLDNPNYKMDIYNPLLYGESNNGKVYILGFKN